MNRRRFLGGVALAAPVLTRWGGAFAAPTQSPRLLVVFLRGGYDCANAIIPYASDFYYEARPTIAIARPTAADGAGALKLDADWALAPALRSTIGTRFAQREVSFVPFAGTDDLSRSHFETQDYIERGQPASGTQDFHSGFLARLSSALTDAPAIAFTDALPRCFQGANIPNIALRGLGLGKPAFDARQSSILASMYKGGPMETAVNEGLEVRQAVALELAQELREANRGSINPKGFELEARQIGHLMHDRYRIGFVDIGGWDTHVGQGGAQGALANNLDSLGRGLVALADELGPSWRDTVVVVISEFGRTFRENGNKGTDHGHGSTYWILGGGIRGGSVLGAQMKVERANLLQDRDYPVLNDIRGLLAGLFGRMFSLSVSDLDRVFPGATPIDLGVV
jgi:uncharacterized protein (DUF1501 family)